MSWRTVTFEDAPFEIIDGDRGKNYPSQNQLLEDGHCLFLSATNVTKDGFVFDNCQFITQEKHEALRKGTVDRGDVILTTRGTLGNVAYYSESVPFPHVRINSGMVTIKSDSAELLSPYVYYYLKSDLFQSQVRALQSGAAQPQLPIRDIKKIKFNYPDLPTQERIASILSAYDDLIENYRRRIALLEQAARLLYREWFVHFRFPGHETTKFVDGLPEEWHMMKVEDAVRRQPPGVLYSQKTALPQGNVPILDQGQSGTIGYHNSEPSFEASLDNPVIVFANHTCYQRIIHFPFSAIQNVLPFKPSERVPDQIYWLHHATFGLVNLNAYKGHWPEFKIKELIVPTEELAENFSKNVGPMHLEIQKLTEANEKLTKARDLLLPRLMDGRIPVKV